MSGSNTQNREAVLDDLVNNTNNSNNNNMPRRMSSVTEEIHHARTDHQRDPHPMLQLGRSGQLNPVSENEVIITWTTDELATSQIKYASQSDFSDSVIDPQQDSTADETDHSITLSNLEESTTYYYQIISTDQFGKD